MKTSAGKASKGMNARKTRLNPISALLILNQKQSIV